MNGSLSERRLYTMNNFTNVAYLVSYPEIYLPYMIMCGVAIVVGTSGNLIVIGTVLYDNKLKNNSAYILMLNLASADLIVSSLIYSFTIVGIVRGREFFEARWSLCRFIASCAVISCSVSITSMCLMAVNRYINICHNPLYSKYFSVKKTIMHCCGAWVIAILVEVPNHLRFGGHVFEWKTASCLYNRLESYSYTILLILIALYIPLTINFICYLRIFIFAFNAKRRVTQSRDKFFIESLKIAKSLFFTFLLFAFCWLPYGIMVCVDYDDNVSAKYYVLVVFLGLCNSTVNPVSYYKLNPTFRASCRNFLWFVITRNVSKNRREQDQKSHWNINKSTHMPLIPRSTLTAAKSPVQLHVNPDTCSINVAGSTNTKEELISKHEESNL